MILRTPHRRAQITFPLLAQSRHAKNAIDVAIGGKADMACCSAHMSAYDPKRTSRRRVDKVLATKLPATRRAP
jgi:hypothetical protein